jgi:hypothetical protein
MGEAKVKVEALLLAVVVLASSVAPSSSRCSTPTYHMCFRFAFIACILFFYSLVNEVYVCTDPWGKADNDDEIHPRKPDGAEGGMVGQREAIGGGRGMDLWLPPSPTAGARATASGNPGGSISFP